MDDLDAITILSLREKLQQLGADLAVEAIDGAPHIVLRVEKTMPQEPDVPAANDEP